MIELILDPYPAATMQARRDFAHITQQRIIEKPYWFRDTNTGIEYRGIYGAIGWPQKITGRGDELPGYAVIVGARKDEEVQAEESRLDILDEVEERSEDLLIHECANMRNRWGYGVHDSLIPVFIGDYRPFELVVAHYNSRVSEDTEDESQAFIVSPPDDYESSNSFDIYMGRLRTVLSAKAKRLYINNNTIIKNRIVSFSRDDPAIMALGGLIHTLLLRQPWMEQAIPSVWQIEEV